MMLAYGVVAERFRQSSYCSDVAGSNPGKGMLMKLLGISAQNR